MPPNSPNVRRLSPLIVLLAVVHIAPASSAAPAFDPLALRIDTQTVQEIPLPEEAVGIGPGSRLHIWFDHLGYGALCTANFIWRDAAGRLYLGTAGHCLLPGVETSDQIPPEAQIRPTVLVRDCDLSGCTPEFVDLGEIAYARQSGIGRDFGIVRIPPSLYALLRPSMPVWGGPVAEGLVEAGEPVGHYGHGWLFNGQFVTRGRAGVGVGTGYSGRPVYAAGWAVGGDSGSALNVLGPSGFEAAGIVTHAAPTGLFIGTTIRSAKAIAAEGGLEIAPVLAGQSPQS